MSNSEYRYKIISDSIESLPQFSSIPVLETTVIEVGFLWVLKSSAIYLP